MVEITCVCDICGNRSPPIRRDNSYDSGSLHDSPIAEGWAHIDTFVGATLRVSNPTRSFFSSPEVTKIPQMRGMADAFLSSIPEQTEPLSLCLSLCPGCLASTGLLATKIEDELSAAKLNRTLAPMSPPAPASSFEFDPDLLYPKPSALKDDSEDK